MKNLPHKAVAYGLGLMLGLALPFLACAKETGQYSAPSLDGYTLDKTLQKDTDEVPDGVNETTIEIYRNQAAQGISRYVTKGKLWAIGVLNNPKNLKAYPANYLLRDSNGDGIFDERYTLQEHFYLPTYLK